MTDPGEWEPIDGLELEVNAERAIRASGENVVVSAGPGAGKTELLAQRADFLLSTRQSRYPSRILAVSFKVDAARNLHDRVRLRSGPRYAARVDSLTFHAFAKRLVDNYRPALAGYSALDADYEIDIAGRIPRKRITFDDLVPLAIEILQSNRFALHALRQTYSHVFLDEFQDCTAKQYELIRLAFRGTPTVLTAVGDTKQRIMAWAGALDGIMQTFADDFDAQARPLYLNFRSAPRLRRMQSRMVAEMDPDSESAREIEGEGGLVEVLAFDDDTTEADGVADIVEGWIAEGIPPSEIAVLVRQQPHLVAAPLAEQLLRRGVPFRNEQAHQDLTAEPAAALILNFLRVIADDRQPDAFADLMRISRRSHADAVDPARFDSSLKRFITESRRFVRAPEFERADTGAWESLIRAFLGEISRSALVALSRAYAQGARLDDVVKHTLEAFSAQLEVDGDPVAALDRLSEIGAVRCLTIHKCKGLEFERVVILGTERQLFWGDDAMSEFFVAVSRAKSHLLLTHAHYRERPDGFSGRWDEDRDPHREFLDFAVDALVEGSWVFQSVLPGSRSDQSEGRERLEVARCGGPVASSKPPVILANA